MNMDADFMRLALDQARQAAEAGEVPVGAVLVRQDPVTRVSQVVAAGRNAPIADHDPTAHAEIQALRAAGRMLGNYRLEDCTLYVTLEPCPMCAGAMLHARLRRVVYGAADPKTGAAGSAVDLFDHAQLNHQTHVRGGVLAEECGALLQDFFKGRRSQARQAAQQEPSRFPLREDALRTPEARFADLPGYPWTPHYLNDLPALGGLRLHYLDEGPADTARTWLCLHDAQGWSYRYRQHIPRLLALGHRVVVPDLIGFGKSDKPKKPSFHSLDWHRQMLSEFIEHLGLRNVRLCLPLRPDAMTAPDWIARLGLSLGLPLEYLPIEEGKGEEAGEAAPFPDPGHRAVFQAAPRL